MDKPLSPGRSVQAYRKDVRCRVLFVMLMSVLMSDVTSSLTPGDRALLHTGDLSELLYADDTLLMSINAGSLQRFLKLVSDAGGGIRT